MIKMVVFDLDGTLANTANLTDVKRVPADVLGKARPDGGTSLLSFGNAISTLPGRLIANGIEVGVLTRSPLAYSSTLLGLLGIDYSRLAASAGGSIEERAQVLRELASRAGFTMSEVQYVGDQSSDREVAQLAGTSFFHALWEDGDEAPDQLVRLHRATRWNQLGTDDGDWVHTIDEAAKSVRRGTAISEEADHLFQVGLWSLLIKCDAVQILSDPAARAQLSGKGLPWANMYANPQAWSMFEQSGDLHRLLDIPDFHAAARLPSEKLNRSMREIEAGGGSAVLTEAWEALPAQVQRRIPRPSGERPVGRLVRHALLSDRALSHEVVPQLENGSFSEMASSSIAGAILLSQPGTQDRKALQGIFLKGLGPHAVECVLERIYRHSANSSWPPNSGDLATTRLIPQLVTWSELREDSELRGQYVAAIGRLFPPRRVDRQAVVGSLPIHANVGFRERWGGDILGPAKNWSGGETGHSGQAPRLGLLMLPAAGVAATVLELYGDDATLVPVPSTAFSTSQPSEFSDRLAVHAGRLAGLDCQRLLAKVDRSTIRFVGRERPGGRIILVDDQATRGESIAKALRALREVGLDAEGAVVWSASGYLAGSKGPLRSHCWWDEARRELDIDFVCSQHRPRS